MTDRELDVCVLGCLDFVATYRNPTGSSTGRKLSSLHQVSRIRKKSEFYDDLRLLYVAEFFKKWALNKLSSKVTEYTN